MKNGKLLNPGWRLQPPPILAQAPVRKASHRHPAFTLIEMLVATVLAAVLMSVVLTMLASVARDRRTLNNLNSKPPDSGIVELFRWDLSNARSIATDNRAIALTGMCGIDLSSLSPDGRLVQVIYELQSGNLWRVQEYLDDSAHTQQWKQLVASDVSNFSLDPNPGPQAPIPAHVRLQLTTMRHAIDQTLWIK